MSHRKSLLSTAAKGCGNSDALLCSGSRATELNTRQFAICKEEWPVLLLKSCRSSSGAFRWPIRPAPVGSGKPVRRADGERKARSSPCRESRREQNHCMTQEASPLVRAKCAGRFSRWSIFEICAVRPCAAIKSAASNRSEFGRKTCLL